VPDFDFTADAVTEAEQTATLTADATIYPHHFKADAWILGERWKHHRVRDHFGIESDLYVALSSDIGPYVAFTPIHYVLEDMVARIGALENNNRVRASFTADAWVAVSGEYGRGIFTADAITEAEQTGSITADAVVILGGQFTADAIIMPSFTADAFIV